MEGEEVSISTSGPRVFLGETPILLNKPFVASVYAATPARIYRFEPETFWKIIAVCPRASRLILATLAERLQLNISVAQDQEKLSALGTLSAGLAHELNNPSAAVRRAAAHLRNAVLGQQSFVCQLGVKALTMEHREVVGRIVAEVIARPAPAALDPLAQSDREAELSAQLENLPDAWELAPALAAAGLDAAWLESVRAQVPEAALGDVLRWVERTVTVNSLLDEVSVSTKRIAVLIKAVKSYSHTDRGQLDDVDIHESLEESLTILGSKLEGIEVIRDWDARLPHVAGYRSELAQVWLSLLDNAAEAAGKGGRIRVRTRREKSQVLVEIQDSGPGVPPELERRIWEPFFTTRGVGKGVGLGLVTAHRIVVGRHDGDLTLDSKPGDTRFQVRLPLERPDR